MRILIFHARLAHLTGGEVNTRDWALGLKARGHKVVVYTLEPGRVAEQVRRAGIAVVKDPSSLTDPPDIMFGCGINDVVSLLARFPDVPAIQLAQVWDHWNAYPCLLPQVVLHVAVDELNAEMFINEFGVRREDVRIIHNAIDVDQLAPRKNPLPARPQRALVIVKENRPHVDAIRRACAERNIAVDFFGYAIGRRLADPLAVMPDYDLVIGAARTAIEGAVGGAAVVVGDHRGLAGLLTSSNLEQFRQNNFGRELLVRPMNQETIGGEIDAYDPADAVAVSRVLRDDASLDRQLDRLEVVFAEAIDRFRRAPPSPEHVRRALSAYLSAHLPRPWEASPRHARFEAGHLDEEIAIVKQQVATTQAQLSAALEQIKQLDARVAAAGEQAGATNAQLAASVDRLVAAEASLATTAECLAAMDQRLSAMTEHLPITDQRLSPLAEHLSAVDQRLSPIGEHMSATDQRVSALAEHVSAADQRLSAAAEHLAAIDQRFPPITEQMSLTDQRLSALGEHLSAVDQRLSPMGEHMLVTDQRLSATAERLAAVEQQLSVTADDVSSVDQRLSATQQQLSVAEGLISAASQHLSAIDQRCAAVEGEISAMSHRLASAAQHATALDQRLSTIEAHATALRPLFRLLRPVAVALGRLGRGLKQFTVSPSPPPRG